MNSFKKQRSLGLQLETRPAAKALGTILGGVFILGLFIFAVALIILFKAYVFVQLWDWFILPVFTTAPVLTYVQAIGVSLVLTFYLATKSQLAEYKDANFIKYLWGHCLVALTAWGIGYIVTLFL